MASVGNFSASVGNWAKQAPERMTAVFRQSVTALAFEVVKTKNEGGHMPVLTGNLRRSLLASTESMPSTKATKDNNKNAGDAGTVGSQVALVAATLKMGQTFYLGFQANYARYAEANNGFVRLTAQKWQSIVRKTATAVKQAYEARNK